MQRSRRDMAVNSMPGKAGPDTPCSKAKGISYHIVCFPPKKNPIHSMQVSGAEMSRKLLSRAKRRRGGIKWEAVSERAVKITRLSIRCTKVYAPYPIMHMSNATCLFQTQQPCAKRRQAPIESTHPCAAFPRRKGRREPKRQRKRVAAKRTPQAAAPAAYLLLHLERRADGAAEALNGDGHLLGGGCGEGGAEEEARGLRGLVAQEPRALGDEHAVLDKRQEEGVFELEDGLAGGQRVLLPVDLEPELRGRRVSGGGLRNKVRGRG